MSNDDLPPDSPAELPVEETEKPRVTIKQVLAHFKKEAGDDTKKQGTLWEDFLIVFLREDESYKRELKDVRRPHGQDVGIDIEAKHRITGETWAFQAKFYTASNVSKNDIDSFMSEAEGYDHRVVIVGGKFGLGAKARRSIFERERPGEEWNSNRFDDSTLDLSIFLEDEFLKERTKLRHIRYHKFKALRQHQREAVADVLEGFKTSDRGKMIMACGTGKTFIALKLAERIVPKGGTVLFLSPFIPLVRQTLHEWNNESRQGFQNVAVCSDQSVAKSGKARESDGDSFDLMASELQCLVTTDATALVNWFREKRKKESERITVVYSTYQSIEAVSKAQKMKDGIPEFDLIICDEAHRTAGTRLADQEDSYFNRVHDQGFIGAKKRLYMTATPKVYKLRDSKGDAVKEKEEVKEKKKEERAIYSMDNESQFGPLFHRLTFGEAVDGGLLSKYKVLVIAVDEGYIEENYKSYTQDSAKPDENQISETARFVGCLNGLRKYGLDANDDPFTLLRVGKDDDNPTGKAPPPPIVQEPMRRAIAFHLTKAQSEHFASRVRKIAKTDIASASFNGTLKVRTRHVDGDMNAHERNENLDWVREPTEGEDPPECRILSNPRCLSEGVDVPAMDAVIFLSPRKSKVDIIQAVGRVMRKAPGKEFGYVILPITIPTGLSDPQVREAVNEDNRFSIVVEVLDALCAHDASLENKLSQIELGELTGSAGNIIDVEEEDDDDNDPSKNGTEEKPGVPGLALEVLGKALQSRIVRQIGPRAQWEKSWSIDIAQETLEVSKKIKEMIYEPSGEVRKGFNKFLSNLRNALNPSVGEDAAIEMLGQHIVARPVFDELFQEFKFAKLNPVSQAMQEMLDILSDLGNEKDNEELALFYYRVRQRVKGITTPAGRQKLILWIYKHFFQAAFPKTAENLGIVYTPTEVVDFILHSVNHVAKQEFGKSLADEGVHILDPFTGTGTFIARLIQSGLLPDAALRRKFLGTPGAADYDGELHANEIVLFAYYIASLNIEEAYHNKVKAEKYHPFGGILFGDTFQMAEKKTFGDIAPGAGFSEANSRRAEAQKKRPIRVIVGNPPYSVGQKSANDANQKLDYPHLNERIKETYVKHGASGGKSSMYDSCNRALRWASDRIGDEGVIGFVTNGSFLHTGSASGLRYCLLQEFSHVYCFDLRGNANTSGERRKKESGSVFGGNSKVPVVILILVKKAGHKPPGILHYHDIGDYLPGKKKMDIIVKFGSIESIPNIQEREKIITPDKYHDWLNQQSETLNQFPPMGNKGAKGKADTNSIFNNYSIGVQSNRDAWVYNFSREEVLRNMESMVEEYNQHVQEYKQRLQEYEQYLKEMKNPSNLKIKDSKAPKHPKNLDAWINNNPTQINWAASLKEKLDRQERLEFQPQRMALSQYRPFAKRYFYYEPNCLHVIYQQRKLFPTPESINKVICVTGTSATKDFSALMIGLVPESATVEKGQCFPLYTWEQGQSEDMHSTQLAASRQDNITDYALALFCEAYSDPDITKEDIFYYVYGILHSPEYKKRFSQDLKKILARIPLAHNFTLFRDAGRKLGRLHLDYEKAPLFPLTLPFVEDVQPEPTEENFEFYRVKSMAFGKPSPKESRTKKIIRYNDHITLERIPLEVYEYKINGRSAIEWVMDQYRVKTNKDSGIVNDPNALARELNKPRYILNLLQRVMTVSYETVEIINSLPKENSFREDDATLDLIKTFKAPSRNGGA